MHGSTGTDARPIRRLCNSYDAYAPSLTTPSITATPSATATEANAHPVTCSFESASYNMALKHIYSLPLCSTATSYSVSPRRQCRPWYQRTQHVSPYITRLAVWYGRASTSFIFTLFTCCCNIQAIPTCFCTLYISKDKCRDFNSWSRQTLDLSKGWNVLTSVDTAIETSTPIDTFIQLIHTPV